MKKLFRTLVVFIFLLILAAAALFAYAKYIEPHRLTSETVTVSSPKISEDTKIAVIADTHFGFFYDLEDFDKVIEELDSQNPDILLFLGDLFDNLDHYTGDMSAVSNALSELTPYAEKYAVFGNHDYGGGAQWHYEDIMEGGGFTVLVNESVDLGDIRLTGLDDFLIGYGDTSAAYNTSSERFNLLICHEPDVADMVSDSENNLMIGAHSHGGQVDIPYFTEEFLTTLGEKYVQGLNYAGDLPIYTNIGLGTTKIKARLFAPPTITYFDLSYGDTFSISG